MPKKTSGIARITDDGIQLDGLNIETVCEKTHRKVPASVAALPANQKHPYRHRCAGCAYELGWDEGYAAAIKDLRRDHEDEG